MSSAPAGVGVVGCGVIAQSYLRWMVETYPDRLRPRVCFDVDGQRRGATAERFGLRAAASLDELLAAPDIGIVLNLTNPAAHADVSLAVLAAGKHLYSEKPFALRMQDADRIVDAARGADLQVAGAPSVMFGAPQRTAWRLVREGALGTVHEVYMNAACAGHELWHPHPRYYYQAGAGPLLDLGVYPLTVATTILGPIRRVWGRAGLAIPERTIATGPDAGTRFTSEVPDRVTALIDFAGGATGTLHASFAVAATTAPAFEMHGTLASLHLTDWQNFGAEVRVRGRGEKQWGTVPLPGAGTAPNWSRSVVDLADAAREGRPPRCSGLHARHVLEVMLAIEASAAAGGDAHEVRTGFPPPPPLD